MTLQELLAVIRKATPGPWRACGADRGGCQCRQVWSTSADSHIATFAKSGDDEEGACTISERMAIDNALFAAAFNPAVAEALVNVADAAQFIDHHHDDLLGQALDALTAAMEAVK